MDRLTRREWSPDTWGPSECRTSKSYEAAMTHPVFFIAPRPGAQLQPGEKTFMERAKDKLRDLYRPSVGRTTMLGRKVEKPADIKASGPSGQRDQAKHDCKHANK
jgi:hypothetical protein